MLFDTADGVVPSARGGCERSPLPRRNEGGQAYCRRSIDIDDEVGTAMAHCRADALDRSGWKRHKQPVRKLSRNAARTRVIAGEASASR